MLDNWKKKRQREELRKKRQTHCDEIDKKSGEINGRYTTAETEVNDHEINNKQKLEELLDSIAQLEQESKRYEKQCSQLGGVEADAPDDSKNNDCLTPTERVYLLNVNNVYKVNVILPNKKTELVEAKKICDRACNEFNKATYGTSSGRQAKERKTAAEDAVRKLNDEIRQLEETRDDSQGNTNENDKEAVDTRTLLMKAIREVKKQSQEKRSEMQRIQNESEKKQLNLKKVNEEKIAFLKIVKQWDDVENDIHANIMTKIKESLNTDNFHSLRSRLETKRTITTNQIDDLNTFEKLWRLLEQKEVIGVGHYTELRHELEKINMAALAKDVEKMEDDILNEYANPKITVTELHNANWDTHTKVFQKHFQHLNREPDTYKRPGGASKYLKHRLTVISNTLKDKQEESESLKGLSHFAEESLKPSDIFTSEANFIRIFHEKEVKIAELENAAVAAKKKSLSTKGSHETQITTLELHHTDEVKKLNAELKVKRDAFEKNEKGYIKLKEKHEQAKKDHNKGADKMQQDLQEAKIKIEALQAEKIAWSECVNSLGKTMLGYENDQELKFKEIRREKEENYREEISHYKTKNENLVGRHREEIENNNEKNQRIVDGFEELLDECRKTLTENGEKASTDETNLREMFSQKLLSLEKMYAEDLVDWDKERMDLKCQLLEASGEKYIRKYRIRVLEKKVQSLGKQLEVANERITKLKENITE